MPEEPSELRPDVAFTINKQTKRIYGDVDFEREQIGFHCHDCDWRGGSISVKGGDLLESVCPECEGTDVENKLSTHLDNICDIYQSHGEDFIPLEYLKERFSAPKGRLGNCLNYLLTGNNAYIVFENDETMVYVEDEYYNG